MKYGALIRKPTMVRVVLVDLMFYGLIYFNLSCPFYYSMWYTFTLHFCNCPSLLSHFYIYHGSHIYFLLTLNNSKLHTITSILNSQYKVTFYTTMTCQLFLHFLQFRYQSLSVNTLRIPIFLTFHNYGHSSSK